MINRIIMELYDDYEKGNIDSLIEFTKKTLPSDGTDKLFIGCVLILFSKSSSRYYATREELLSIVKAVKEKICDSNYLAFYVDRVNKEKGISKYLKDIVNDENVDKYADLIIEYLEQFKPKFVEDLKKDNKANIDKYISKMKKEGEGLNFPDYIFEIDGKDIKDARVIYNYGSLERTEFECGKKTKVTYSPTIDLEILGIDDNLNEAYLCFELNLDLETLNNFNNGIEDITKYMLETEAFIKRPNEDKSVFLDFYLPTNKNGDMFHKLTSLYVLKLGNNKFLFKLTVPSENVFTYFEVNFK